MNRFIVLNGFEKAIKDTINDRIYLCENAMGLCLLLNSFADENKKLKYLNSLNDDLIKKDFVNNNLKSDILELVDKSLGSDDVELMRIALINIKKIVGG